MRYCADAPQHCCLFRLHVNTTLEGDCVVVEVGLGIMYALYSSAHTTTADSSTVSAIFSCSGLDTRLPIVHHIAAGGHAGSAGRHGISCLRRDRPPEDSAQPQRQRLCGAKIGSVCSALDARTAVEPRYAKPPRFAVSVVSHAASVCANASEWRVPLGERDKFLHQNAASATAVAILPEDSCTAHAVMIRTCCTRD